MAVSIGGPDEVGPFSSPVDVGIRLKGNYSFRSLDGKAAFKVKFKTGSSMVSGSSPSTAWSAIDAAVVCKKQIEVKRARDSWTRAL